MECKCGKDLSMNKLQTTYKLTYCKWQYGTLICPQCSCLKKSFVKPNHIVGTPKKIFIHTIIGILGPTMTIQLEYDVNYTITITSNHRNHVDVEYIRDIPYVHDVVLASILCMDGNMNIVTVKSQIITMLESVNVYKSEIESTTNTKMQKELETATERIKELESEKEKDDQCIQELQSKLDISCDIQKDILIYTEELQSNIIELQLSSRTS